MPPVRLRKRLDPTSLVAAERHPVTGRLTGNGRRNKSQHGPATQLARHRFSGVVGVLATGALVTLVAGTAAAAVKTGGPDHRSSHRPATSAGPATTPPTQHSAAAATLPPPCQLVSQAAAQRAVGVPVDTSENKSASCLYAGTAPSPFRTVEIRYDNSDPAHIRSTLAASHIAATPIPALGTAAFSHPAFVRTANGRTEFLPAEVVVPVGSTTVVISALTLDEGAGAQLVNPAHDQQVAVALATAALPSYLSQ